MARNFENKVVLVTGASRGIGRAIARLFAEKGAAVAVNYRKNNRLAEEICSEIEGAGGSALSVEADVSNFREVEAMVDHVLNRFEKIDILINNAGIFILADLTTAPSADIDRLYEVNVKGVIGVTRAVAPQMIDRQYGKIVNIASIAALGTSVIGTSGYAMSKAAVIAVTKRTALELGSHKINVNAIAPGFIRTGMGLPDESDGDHEARLKRMAEKPILKRIGEPADIAHAALFLSSDEASFITGQTLVVDGGRMDYLTHSV